MGGGDSSSSTGALQYYSTPQGAYNAAQTQMYGPPWYQTAAGYGGIAAQDIGRGISAGSQGPIPNYQAPSPPGMTPIDAYQYPPQQIPQNSVADALSRILGVFARY